MATAPELLKVPPQKTPLHDEGLDHPDQSSRPEQASRGVFGGGLKGRIFSKVWWKFFQSIVDWIAYLNAETTDVTILGTLVPDAYQTTSDFKGDHLSAHMGYARGESRYYRDGAITSGLSALTSAVGGFLASDVGKIVTVSGAGPSGAGLATTIIAYVSATQVTLATTASTTATAARIVIGIDETQGVLDLMLQPSYGSRIQIGGEGGGTERLIPTGMYLITPGDLLIPNPQSGVMAGQGSRFNTMLVSADPASTEPVLTLGDDTWEPHNFVIEKLTIDANLGASQGALFFQRTNIMGIRDVVVQTLGENCIGVKSIPDPSLFGEMIFDRVAVYGGDDGGIPDGCVGMELYATSNVTLVNCNIENVETGLIFNGATQCLFTLTGGRFERIAKYALILTRCQPCISQEIAVGSVYMSSDVVGGQIMLTNAPAAWPNGVIVDCGFGNRIRRISSMPHIPFIPGGDNSVAVFGTGVEFDGNEWLSVQNLNDDPTFHLGVGGWTAGASAELTARPICMPGVEQFGGAAMAIYSEFGGGYAEKTFDCAIDTDYLIQVGILCRGTQTYKIIVSGNMAGVIWDSGDLVQDFTVTDEWQAFNVFRKRIPSILDTTLTVQIYSVGVAQTTIVSLLLISKSKIRMGTDYATGVVPGGFNLIGTPGQPDFTWELDTATGQTVYSVSGGGMGTDHGLRGKAFARAVVTVPSGVLANIGIVGSGNDPAGGPQVELREGTHEYVIPVMQHPSYNQVLFYSFVFGGTILIQEVGVFAIDTIQPPPFLGQGWMRSEPGNSGRSVITSRDHLYLGSNFNSNAQAAASSGNAFTRCIFGSNIYWNEDAGVWEIPTNGSSDWAALLLLNSGEIGLACETGLTLPTTRTNTQVLAAIKFKIPTSDPAQILNNGYLDLISSGIQTGIRISAGDPNGVVSGLVGMICLDDTGGFWVKTGGGAGNTGWGPVYPGSLLSGTGSPEGSITANTGTLYRQTNGGSGEVLWIKESGSGNTGWMSDGGTIWFPTNSPTNTQFRTNKQIGVNKAPATGIDLDVNGAANFDNTLKMNALTASRPAKLNSSKQFTAALIDVNSANDIAATGFSSTNTPQWDGSKFIPIAGVSVSFTEITSGPTSSAVLADVDLSGVVPPGLTLTKTFINVIDGFSIATHSSTNGIVTS